MGAERQRVVTCDVSTTSSTRGTIVHLIKCGCTKTRCSTNHCQCRKAGLVCTDLCKCSESDDTCDNTNTAEDLEDDDEDYDVLTCSDDEDDDDI